MRIYFLLLASLVTINCFGQNSNDAILTSKLDSTFNRIFNPEEPGGSIFIQKGKQTLYSKSFGLADLKTKEKFTEKTVSNLGSVAKTFVAYGILILQEQGKLSIEDNLLKYFPDFKNKEIASKVKIKHLLTHTSGLPDLRYVSKNFEFFLTAKDAENFAPLKNTDWLSFEPGTRWEYSNPGYNGLALIIEQVSGMKWQKFIEKYVFKPAGMKSSVITDGPFPQKGVAHGYRKVNEEYREYDYGEYSTFPAAGNGGVWCSVEDLQKYVKAIKNCTFLNCETINFSQTPWQPENWTANEKSFQGFTWRVNNVDKDNMVVNHSGEQGGFRAHIYMMPKQDITIIWVINTNNKYPTTKITDILKKLDYIK